jgi:PD-(D/E)XK nuclease superfamily
MMEAASGNSSFSRKLAGLQLAVDSTSISTAKRCLREYELSIIRGFAPLGQQVDLEFGILYHSATEHYSHYRADGLGHEDALRAAVAWTLKATWDSAAGRGWLTDDSNKNRATLLRTVIWYLDKHADDSMTTLILANGKPAVELSFRFELPIAASTGEQFILCGHFDRIADYGGDAYIVDKKTTKHTLGPGYWDQFNPNNQFSTYSFAGKHVFGVPTRGIIVDAAQVAVGFSRFERKPIPRTDAMLDEWYNDLAWTLQRMDESAQAGYWPMNDTACFRCRFRAICSKDPSVREQWLKAEFRQRVWDPLQVRGDI